MKADRQWTIVKGVALFIILALLFHLMVVLVVPDLSQHMKGGSIPAILLGTEHLYREGGQRDGKSIEVWEDPLVQKIREEVVFKRLSEMALSEERKPQPPLPRVSLFPAGKLEEYKKMMILQSARFYHELEKIVYGKEQKEVLFTVTRPKASDVKGGTIPLPEDMEAQRIISSLRGAVQEEGGEARKPTGAVALDIKGPAASRKISYIPPPLQSKLSMDGDVTLKFWILPDGTLDKIIPLVKDDTQAIEVAINQIKKYRFEPLPADVPQVKQWGVIPVQSILR